MDVMQAIVDLANAKTVPLPRLLAKDTKGEHLEVDAIMKEHIESHTYILPKIDRFVEDVEEGDEYHSPVVMIEMLEELMAENPTRIYLTGIMGGGKTRDVFVMTEEALASLVVQVGLRGW